MLSFDKYNTEHIRQAVYHLSNVLRMSEMCIIHLLRSLILSLVEARAAFLLHVEQAQFKRVEIEKMSDHFHSMLEFPD